MSLRQELSDRWSHVQAFLFPEMRREIGPLTPPHERLIVVLDTVDIERHVPFLDGWSGRPESDRRALARAFVGKAALNLPTTEALIDRLAVDATLRRICGWEGAGCVPSASTFSRAFAEFAATELPSRLHEALVARTHDDRLVGHVSIDSTAIEAREKPERKPELPTPKEKRRRGRPARGEIVRPKEEKRLDRQVNMTLDVMLRDLPTGCAVGMKRDAKGNANRWIGYKLHVATGDGDVPLACLLTSANLHDSQAAIPLMEMTAERATSLYDLMDAAYDAPQIRARSAALGHVPIIAENPRRGGKAEAEREALARRRAGHVPAEAVRFRERSAAERVNSGLKDDHGGRFVRVRGHAKVMCHLMFGVLALTVDRLFNLVA